MKLNWQQIQDAIKQLIAEYKYDPMQIVDIVKMGIRTAYRKDYMNHERKATIHVTIGGDWSIKIYREWTIVEEIEDKEDDRQINLEIKQNLKNIERERFYEKFQDKQWELLKAKILRVIAESVVLDIDGATVVLPPNGQVPNRVYNTGEEIIVFLNEISKGSGGINLDITQAGPDFIDALLKRIVPEYEEELVNVEKIVRMTWKRTKMIVSTNDENIDPVGVFVGHRGDRINTILSLLGGEKIDIIEQQADDEKWFKKMVVDALLPAKVGEVNIDEDKGMIYVNVSDDQKPLAIGQGAVNVRLAGQLVGYRIELV